jgi:hypothetical protein
MKKKPAITKKEALERDLNRALRKRTPPKEEPLYMEIAQLDQAVDAFSTMMRARLHEKALLGWRGWNDSNKGPSSKVIRESLKYDAIPTSKAFDEIESIDIANKAMFLWYRKVMGG